MKIIRICLVFFLLVESQTNITEMEKGWGSLFSVNNQKLLIYDH
jgi:hypothetical protein